MLNKMRNRQGFTLIELLIVVAIIGILAAIAIPQFSAYRQKGYNSAANADIKNAKTSQESLFADHQTYGKSETGIKIDAVTKTVAGAYVLGAVPAATSTIVGAALSGPKPDPADATKDIAVGVGFGLSNGVTLISNGMTEDATAKTSNSYIMLAKHVQGTRVFGTETESTSVMFVQADEWGGFALSAAGPAGPNKTFKAPANLAAPTTGVDIAAGVDGGGVAPNDKWAAL